MAFPGVADPSQPVAGDELARKLIELAYNLRWTWHAPSAAVFARMAPETWRETHNAVAVLRALSRDDDGRLAHFASAIDAAHTDLREYLARPPVDLPVGFGRVAYLSAEFGVAGCLPIYSGGLGVLAGDHLKAASDLGVPVVGIGLLYRYGYFRQWIDRNGYQREAYDQADPARLPLQPVVVGGRPLQIEVPFPGRVVHARVWRANVGRAPLYLLDTHLAENSDEDCWITGHLYGGDQDTRIRQELLLGIGAARLMRALTRASLEPHFSVCHLNEGHSAFVILELAAGRLADGLATTFEAAMLQVAPHVVFSTHTPVSAGHDAFPSALVEHYLSAYAREMDLSMPDLLRLGGLHPNLDAEPFNMTVLALRGSARRNAVSRLHAAVSRTMWSGVGVGASDAPPVVAMEAITNGVHPQSWVGPEMASLFDAQLGPGWRVRSRDAASWNALVGVPRTAVWQARTAQRERLIARADLPMDANPAMVIGFARRFATYKRAGLLLDHANRLAELIAGTSSRPIALVFAGKAHPQDDPGKRLVQRVVEASRDGRFRGHLVFLEDYDLELARLLVQGADVWLNTPRRPQEACGTSGMKAAMNGALQLSELDGWWDEAYRPELGWALGTSLAEDLSDDARDAAEAAQLMDLLEQEIVPSFYDRDASGVPVGWLNRIVSSVVALAANYSAERMVGEYACRAYWPAATAGASGIDSGSDSVSGVTGSG